MCPVKINNERVKMRKHLLLFNLKELHLEFKNKYPANAIGLSKFCELRPKWVVSAGDIGAHNVCICATH